MARSPLAKSRVVRRFRVAVESLESRRLMAVVPVGFADETFVPAIDEATSMTFAPDGRLFVTVQSGDVRVVKNGQLLATPFATLNVDSFNERGVLGLAFDPNFQTNNHLYIYYTVPANGSTPARNRLSRFTANGDIVTPGSEFVLKTFTDLSAGNHNGGAIHFGADNKLYLAIGDGGNTPTSSQSMTSPKGKLLRMNTDGSPPTDNPFYNNNGVVDWQDYIWALGLRNPFTFDVQPGTGTIYINDVGQFTWEEINVGVKGANYGWPNSEGPSNVAGYTAPKIYYAHGNGPDQGFAITGGAFYNPTTQQYPTNYTGKYFFADYVGGWIRLLDPATNSNTTFASGLASPVDLDVGPDGSLYYLEYSGGAGATTGRIGRIVYTPNVAATVTTDPVSRSVSVGQPATFSVQTSGTSPITYQWQRNNINITGATSASYTLPSAQPADNSATFRVIVTNAYGTDTSANATLTVVGNAAPVPTIVTPTVGTKYKAGTYVQFSGRGTDAEDGTLVSTRFSWSVVFHHDTHTHPFIPSINNTKAGQFLIPTTGETSANVFYRIFLTVTDSSGTSTTTFRDVAPLVTTQRLITSPAGLGLSLDGQPKATPISFNGVVGVSRLLTAPATQVLNGKTWAFDSWSDGGAREHTISTPALNSTTTAVYRLSAGNVGTGTGLSATYFDNANFTGSAVTRTDRSIAFNWGNGSPAPAIGNDTFSARWTGQIAAQFSQTYTISAFSDNGVRVWINGVQVINAFTKSSPSTNTGTITLTAGVKVPIVIEYNEQAGGAQMQLSWSSASTPLSIIPGSQLYPTSGAVRLTSATVTPAAAPVFSTAAPIREESLLDSKITLL